MTGISALPPASCNPLTTAGPNPRRPSVYVGIYGCDERFRGNTSHAWSMQGPGCVQHTAAQAKEHPVLRGFTPSQTAAAAAAAAASFGAKHGSSPPAPQPSQQRTHQCGADSGCARCHNVGMKYCSKPTIMTRLPRTLAGPPNPDTPVAPYAAEQQHRACTTPTLVARE
jgi:hypothetical protein